MPVDSRGEDADNREFTGDGAGRDHEGYYWIRGRVDDVVNVSGHRLSTAEIEAALLEHSKSASERQIGRGKLMNGQTRWRRRLWWGSTTSCRVKL